MNDEFNIAVVGAGMAGLSCATALQHAGYQVSVFDKSRGPGGRMSTRRGEGWQCDHGAQFFTANDPGFRAEVARWERAGVAVPWYPLVKRLDGDGVANRVDPVARFVGAPRMTAPAAMLGSALALYTGQAITALQRDSSGWRLSSDGEALPACRFDAVVLALPAPQAAALLRDAAPVYATLSAQVPMAPCWTLMAQYPAPLATGFDAAQVDSGPLRWIARDRTKPGRVGQESWVLQASAAWSAAHIEADAEEVAAALITAFIALGGAPPVQWSAHRWRYATAAAPRTEGCLWDADARLGLCGDWLGGDTVEAAWLSGRKLAHEISAS